MLTRRQWLTAAVAAALAMEAGAAPRGASALKAIHRKVGGRMGVHILDSQSGRRIAYDDDSRYAMASTVKLPLAAALLWQVDHGAFSLTHQLPIGPDDLLPNSPVLEPRIAAGATGMTVQELCAAAVTHSDNAAANVLFAGIGGPAALTTFIRSIGDQTTRFDRTELELNANLPGDERDTTTPHAMVENMLKIFTQDVLSVASRALLIDWMSMSRTGLDRVRAGLPRSWQSGDKTGWGQNGAYNDLVITWPPDRRPILIAVYMSESKLDPRQLAAAHAEVGELVGREKWR
jgi:beta-lactamase class A